MSNSDPRVNRSRRALMDAGIELFLVNPAASLSDVAAKAGVGRATLYRHFETREHLINAIVRESLEQTDELLKPIKQQSRDARHAIESIIHTIMPMADRYHFILVLWSMLEDETSPAWKIYDRQIEDLRRLVVKGQKQGCINKSLDSMWVVTVIDSLLYAGWWLVRSGEMSTESAAEQAVATLFMGIGKQ